MAEDEDGKYRDILAVMSSVPSTTEEIISRLGEKAFGCPDGIVKSLNIMRRKSQIKGTLLRESGKWVWWR